MTAVSVPTARRPLPSVDALLSRWGGLRALALLRALLGVVVIRHLWPDVRASVLPVERFHVPWWSWLPVPSPTAYRVLLWIGVAAGVAMVVGVITRAATATALAVVAYLLVVDMTGFAHNRAFLVWLLVGVTLVFAGAQVSRHRRWSLAGDMVGPLWPVYLLRILVASVYLTSGLTKLGNDDWRSGLVLWDRLVRHSDRIPIEGWIHDVVTSRAFHQVLAPSAIAVELFLAVALWFRRTRLLAVWIAIAFHTSIEVVASVQTFSWSAIVALLIWVSSGGRDRVLCTSSPWLRRAVRWLDWLDRFDVADAAPGRQAMLVERDGVIRYGRDARLTALSRLPLLFPVVAPALALHRAGARVRSARAGLVDRRVVHRAQR